MLFRSGLCRRKILIPSVVKHDVEMRPVVETCAGDVAVVEGEAEGSYEMKRHAQPHAESAYRPCIVRDFRTQEDD